MKELFLWVSMLSPELVSPGPAAALGAEVPGPGRHVAEHDTRHQTLDGRDLLLGQRDGLVPAPGLRPRPHRRYLRPLLRPLTSTDTRNWIIDRRKTFINTAKYLD